MSPAAKGGSLLSRLLLVFLGVLIALAGGEAALRLRPVPNLEVLGTFDFPPVTRSPEWADPPPNVYAWSNPLGRRHAPNMDVAVPLAEHAGGSFRFRTNNLGLRRDTDTDIERVPHSVRILVLGDSHTDGYVDNGETFSALLEARLQGWAGIADDKIEVLNGAVVTYTPAQQLLWYREHGAHLKPDLVVSVFYVGNDVVELLDPSRPGIDPLTGQAIPAQPGDDPSASSDPFGQLRLGQLARFAIQTGPLAEPWRQLGLPGRFREAGGYPIETLVEVFRRCHGCYWQSLGQAARARRDPHGIREGIEQAGAILTRLGREVEADGGRFVVALLPTHLQIEPARASQEAHVVATLLGLDNSDLSFDDKVTSAISGDLRAGGIATILLRKSLESARTLGPLYYNRDWHLAPLGHRVVAAALETELIEQIAATRPPPTARTAGR